MYIHTVILNKFLKKVTFAYKSNIHNDFKKVLNRDRT